MTKKHFISMAIEFGDLYRDIDYRHEQTEQDGTDIVAFVAEDQATRNAMYSFCAVAREINPRFDQDRFIEFVMDVRSGARDLTGKKVK